VRHCHRSLVSLQALLREFSTFKFSRFPTGVEFVEQNTCIFEQLVEHRALLDMSRLFAKLVHAELLTMGFVRGEALNDICIQAVN
jgi:hypothetical protein